MILKPIGKNKKQNIKRMIQFWKQKWIQIRRIT